jgi:hypothetical protein
MKAKYLLILTVIVGFASCATFKSGQTPDDVYYSPAKKYAGEENRDQAKNKEEYNYEDRSIRMKTTDYRRWSSLENPYYFDDYRYDYNCNCNCNTGYYNYGYYGKYNYFGYRPAYYGNYWNSNVLVYTPSKPKYTAPRGGTFGNSNSYSNRNYDNKNNSGDGTKSGGSLINRIFNSNNSSSSGSSRTYEPSNSKPASSGSSSGSSGSSSRPGRTGN